METTPLSFEEYCLSENSYEDELNEECEYEVLKEFLYENQNYFVDLLVAFIHDSNFNPFKCLNCMGTNDIKIYQSPSLTDKKILLNTIISYIVKFTSIKESEINLLIKGLVEVYDKVNFIYTFENDYNPINIFDINTFYQDDKVSESILDIINSLMFIDYDLATKYITISEGDSIYTLTDEEKILLKIQLFTFASVFINIDKLIKTFINFAHQ